MVGVLCLLHVVVWCLVFAECVGCCLLVLIYFLLLVFGVAVIPSVGIGIGVAAVGGCCVAVGVWVSCCCP